jgi:uncharacterized repeat protein (TIGR01451 family)
MHRKSVSSVVAPLIAIISFVFLIGVTFALAQTSTPAVEGSTEPDIPDQRLLNTAEAEGRVRVIAGLLTPGYSEQRMAESSDVERDLVDDIADARNSVLRDLEAHQVMGVKAFDFIPYIAMTVDADGLRALFAHPLVTSVEDDFVVEPDLTSSVTIVKANLAHILLYLGVGKSIAILDTGVDKFHADLAGKVVSEACYSATTAGYTSLCPGGVSSSTAANSALPCNLSINGCYHGTHVAGTAAGVAPGANIIAIQVFSRTNDCGASTAPCARAQVSDILSGLNRVYALRNTFSIASVNMSLGSGQYTGTCDNVSSAMQSTVNLLRNVNISTVASAGNAGYRNAMGWPACHSNIISVGSTTKFDQVSDFSNVSTLTTLLAPGSDIFAPMPTGWSQTHASLSGTSMAAPHVAGAIAILKDAQSTLTAAMIQSNLVTGGVLVSDQRPGGTVTKRRLDVWGSVCRVITCDADDFRFIATNQTLNGTISLANDVDHYYYSGQAGERLTLRLNRTSGTFDPYLELFAPNGFRVAFNNNGGGGVNSLINGYTLAQSGLYRVRASGAAAGTGSYQLSASRETVTLNPVPTISFLSPPSATGTFFGSDFWVAIYGDNFMPESQVRWNGQLRAKYYSSSRLIYIRVLGSDIGWPWPRSAFVNVTNPTPGGGTSNARAFSIYDPFLGESALVAPESGSTIAPGISTTMVFSWTHPTDSWRTMQNMDLRLRNDAGETAMWLRISEGSPTSTLSLLNSSATAVLSTTLVSGVQGQGPDLVIPDQVTLHTEQTIMFGSGQTIVVSPTVTFGPLAAGTYNVEFMVDNEEGEVQADDILGTIVIQPPECAVSLESVSLTGPATGTVNTPYAFNAMIEPGSATAPIVYSWAPEPDSGQGTASATYSWSNAGEQVVFLGVENCGTFVADLRSVRIRTGTEPDLTISKVAPATALAGDPVTYTLTITNSGALIAANVQVRDVLPAGATYISGGSVVGDEVQWSLPSLDGYGTVAEVQYVVAAATDLHNSTYSVSASGGYSASGGETVTTRVVDAQVSVTPVTSATLSYGTGARTTTFDIPAGSLFADTVGAYEELTSPGYVAAAGSRFAGRAFRLDAYQNNEPVPGLRLGEATSIVVGYSQSDVAGLNENLLDLFYWNGSRWSSLNCQRDTTNNRLMCEAAEAMMTQYALFEVDYGLYLPLIVNNSGGLSAQITGITVAGSQYSVLFQASGFQAQVPGQHVHFFFDSVPPGQAGVPGAGPWYVYGGQSPFTGYRLADRPAGASRICILVANSDHSIILNSGNCTELP